MNTMLTNFKAARRVSTPLLAIQTPDPAATIAAITSVDDEVPAIQWDILAGLSRANQAGAAVVDAILGEVENMMLTGPAGASAILDVARDKTPERTILIIHNAHRYLDDPSVSQGLWNLRDVFSTDGRMVVLLGPSITLPPELGQDVLVLEEPLPDTAQLEQIVTATYAAVEDGPDVDEAKMAPIVDALVGLAAFPAEQAAAMSLKRAGMDVDSLWDRKRAMIEQTPGLTVWRGSETMDQVGGLDNVKTFLGRLLNGNSPPRCIVFIDEIEKALAGSTGAAGDSSGVSQDYLGQLLTHMQDTAAEGLIAVGPPGSGKSMIAKVAGSIAGIPTIQMDLGGMKGSLVGQSEQALRTALRVVTAISGGDALFLATCNKIAVLPPELKRRFGLGTFFFDLPNDDERRAIWPLYDMYGNRGTRPADDGWTGAEIRKCCEIAYRLDCTLDEAAAYIVPVAQSAREQIEDLRSQASGKFISASYAGTYRRQTAERAPGGRNLQLED